MSIPGAADHPKRSVKQAPSSFLFVENQLSFERLRRRADLAETALIYQVASAVRRSAFARNRASAPIIHAIVRAKHKGFRNRTVLRARHHHVFLGRSRLLRRGNTRRASADLS